MITMNDAYHNGYLGNGIFTDLQSYNVPWRDEHINASLDILYYSKSGDKFTGNIINRVMTGEHLSQVERDSIAEALFTLFQTKWTKLYAVMFEEYNPIENYRMTETESSTHSVESTNANTGTVTNANTGTVSNTDTGTITNTDDTETTLTKTGTDTTTNTGTVGNQGSNNVTNGVYGFNSSSAVNSDVSNGTNGNTETRNLTNQETLNTTDTESTDGTKQETRNLTAQETRNLTNLETLNTQNAIEESGENEREMTRSGNIGVTTSQQLLQSEIELWEWNFFNQVFTDIDSTLCLLIY